MLKSLNFKSHIIGLCSFFLVISSVTAQERKIQFSLEIGATLSKFDVTQKSQFSEYKGPYRQAPSFYVGTVVDLPILQTWSFTTGLRVMGKAANTKNDPVPEFDDKGYKESFYLEAPIMVNKDIRIAKANLFLGAGIYAAYMFSGNEHHTWSAYTTNPNSPSYGEFDLFNNTDAGLIFNGGVLASKKLSFSAGYELGLRNILNNPLDAVPKTELSNRTITAGIQLKL